MRRILTFGLILLFCSTLVSIPESIASDDHGFQFVRIKYGSNSGSGRRGRGGWGTPPWQHDYPTAEENLYEALERTTKINVSFPYLILSLKDKRIFEYPFLYLCEPGFWTMDDTEVENLRKYLNRGGFILFDDFRDAVGGRYGGRGKREWNNFYRQLKKSFPDKEIVQVEPDHKIWSIYYDIDPIAAPSLVSPRGGEDEYYAMYDDKGRMMVFVCYNQDIGDGWEWPNRNLNQASTISFQMGINFIIYALSH